MYNFPAGAGTRKFFQKNFSKKKIGPLSKPKFFFPQKVKILGFSCQVKKFVFCAIETCFGSGPTWHMTKIIFQKKNPFNWEKKGKVLGSILRSSVKE